MLVAGGESVPENDGIIRKELSIGVLATSHKNVEENIGKATPSSKNLSVLDDFTSFRPAFLPPGNLAEDNLSHFLVTTTRGPSLQWQLKTHIFVHMGI